MSNPTELPDLDALSNEELIEIGQRVRGIEASDRGGYFLPITFGREVERAVLARRAQPEGKAIALLKDAARAWNNEASPELDAAMERIECFLIDSSAEPEGEAPPSAAVIKAWDRFERAVGKPEGEAPQADALTPLDYRAQGREEALAIILGQSAEDPFSAFTDWGTSGAPQDEGSAYWKEDELRALLHIGDRKYDAYDRAEGAYWEALGEKDEAKREMLFVQQSPFYKPLHDFLAKHEAWELMGDLKRAQPAATLSPLCGAQHAESGAQAALEQAAALVVKMTAPPRDLLGAPTAPMKATASLGERIAAAIRAITPVAAQSQGAHAALIADEPSPVNRVKELIAAQQAAAPGSPDGWVGTASIQGEATSVAFRDERTARSVCSDNPFPFWRSAKSVPVLCTKPVAALTDKGRAVIWNDNYATEPWVSSGYQPLYLAPPSAPGTPQADRWSWSKRGMELDPNGHYATYSAPGTPEAPKKPAHGHRDDYYLLANGRRLGLESISRVRNMPNWVLAMGLFATGSTSAHQICHDAGIDPDSTTIQRAAAPKGGA